MEVSVQKGDASDFPSKARSVDLKGIYVEKSRGSGRKSLAGNGSLRDHQSPCDSGSSVSGESRRKRSRKEISLSIFEQNALKRHRKGLVVSRRKPNGFVSGVGKQEELSSPAVVPASVDNGCSSLQNVGDSLAIVPWKELNYNHPPIADNVDNSNGLGHNVVIPKRPRGVLRKRKAEKPISSRKGANDTCSDKSGATTPKHEPLTNLVSNSQSSASKRKKKLNEVKENGTGNGSSKHVIRRKARRKEASSIVNPVHVENNVQVVEDDKKLFGNFQEDDEENLEQNAARMLSSRFDPRCTGFSGSGKVSTSEPANRTSFVQSGSGNFMRSRSESSSVDAAGRVLRPRKHNGKGLFRKRRHFYEVCSKDVDPYCILKQRIRVFWPLDRVWYVGLVKDYDPLTGLHHVKYEDRDEEWIDLQNERFKLLLFPSEVAGRFTTENSRLELKQEDKGHRNSIDNDCLSNFMESEPIISWLARSSHRQKLLPTHSMKKQRTHLLKQFEPSMLLEPKGHTAINSCSRNSNSLFTKCTASVGSIDGDMTEMPELQSRISSNDRRLSFVYFRKRFRKGVYGALEKDLVCGNSSGSISILASVAHRAAALEELSILAKMPTELKKIIIRLSLRPLCIHDLAFGGERFWLCRALYLLQHGKLMHLWPSVRMEIVIVDNVLGLRRLLFEGSLRRAVDLTCLIISTFYRHNELNDSTVLKLPFTSIGLHLSGLHDEARGLHFALYSFLELESTRWRYLEDKLMSQCMTMGELPAADCTYSNIMKLQSHSCQTLQKYLVKNPVSLEVFPERSCSDIMHQFIPGSSLHLNMNPALCYIDENYGRLPASSFCIATAPSFLLSLHLKLLIENSVDVKFRNPSSVSLQDCPDNHDKLTINDYLRVEVYPDQVSDLRIENLRPSLGLDSTSSGKPAASYLKVEIDSLTSDDGELMRCSHDFLNSEVNMNENSVGNRVIWKNDTNEACVQIEKVSYHTGLLHGSEKSHASCHEGSSLDKSESPSNSSTQTEGQSFDKVTHGDQSASVDLVREERAIHLPNPTAPRSTCHRNRHSSLSPIFDHHKKLWPEDSHNGFASGSKKPRTHVTYSSPHGAYEFGSKTQGHQKKTRLYKRIRTDNPKSMPGGLESPHNFHKPLICDANVLVIDGDRGWREGGAQVFLDSDDQRDWRICVKVSGATKYVHKPQHLLQPGITNRYNHAMMWKGGKDWTLEFTERSQWSLFKEIHEECYNRNIRATYNKNIPIPGVRQIADDGDSIIGVPFVRSSSKYFQQVGTEVDMALDTSRVLYDMDSGDEEWISKMRNPLDTASGEMSEITDDMFERAMDVFEKFAYAQQCDEFSSEEMEEFMDDVGPPDVISAIYEHWRQKRQKKGLPLVRQFQPALWEHYQKQLKEWELAMSKLHNSVYGCQEKACSIKKPPMFAFCLRPRGLETSNKGTKQKHHKKFMLTNHNYFGREQDGVYYYGRKSNGLSIGEEKAIGAISSYESSDCHLSPSTFSPRDAGRMGVLTVTNDGSDRSPYPKLYRNSSKRGMFSSPRDSQIMPFSYNKNVRRNDVNPWNVADTHEWASATPSQPNGLRRHQSDIDEFRLRDASSAAQHASNMAKLKREKAQWLLHKADLALHKATSALLIAEAIKESENDLIDDR